MSITISERSTLRTMFYQQYMSYCAALSLFVIVTQGLLCPYEVCYCAGPDIGCDDRSLQEIPTLLVENNTFFESVFFDTNLIRTVSSGSLPPNLREISLENNPISTIDATAFDGSANTLGSLSFNGANFSKIPDAFHHLRALKYLSIINSQVDDWNPDAMANIGTTVDTLNLDNVGFTRWPVWMQNFTQVIQLSITTSSISAIPDDGLEKLSNKLERLTLNNNRLKEVPKTLSKMSTLRRLTLDNNNIVNVKWLPRNSILISLSLSSNRIADSDMVSNALQLDGSLTDLHLNENKLTYIPDLMFLTGVSEFNFTGNQLSNPLSGTLPPNVSVIDLGHNQFSLIPQLFWNHKSVTDLVMPYNKLSVLDQRYIPPWITAVQLGFNLITELTDTSFPTNSTLQFVRLNNNPIVKISNLAFVNLPRLAELGLQSTQLTRLPMALHSLKGIVTIDLSGSSSLVCTCLESSLQSWILSQDSENIIGNCGQTSVYAFFQYLSSDCPV